MGISDLFMKRDANAGINERLKGEINFIVGFGLENDRFMQKFVEEAKESAIFNFPAATLYSVYQNGDNKQKQTVIDNLSKLYNTYNDYDIKIFDIMKKYVLFFQEFLERDAKTQNMAGIAHNNNTLDKMLYLEYISEINQIFELLVGDANRCKVILNHGFEKLTRFKAFFKEDSFAHMQELYNSSIERIDVLIEEMSKMIKE